jgi:hypothetical protein
MNKENGNELLYLLWFQRDSYRGPGAIKLLSLEILRYILSDITMAFISEQYWLQVTILVGYIVIM